MNELIQEFKELNGLEKFGVGTFLFTAIIVVVSLSITIINFCNTFF